MGRLETLISSVSSSGKAISRRREAEHVGAAVGQRDGRRVLVGVGRCVVEVDAEPIGDQRVRGARRRRTGCAGARRAGSVVEGRRSSASPVIASIIWSVKPFLSSSVLESRRAP